VTAASSLPDPQFSNNVGGHTLPANITGYNGLTNVTAQPFQADNIVLLQDGLCGSACAIFSELMKEQGKVQTVVIGGRPLNAPMQVTFDKTYEKLCSILTCIRVSVVPKARNSFLSTV